MASQGYLDVTGMRYRTAHEHQRSVCIVYHFFVLLPSLLIVNLRRVGVRIADTCQSAGAVYHLQTFKMQTASLRYSFNN